LAKSLTSSVEKDVKILTEKNKSLLRRRSELLQCLEELESIKKKCKDLTQAKAQLEAHSRNILMKIESKEHLLGKYDASQLQSPLVPVDASASASAGDDGIQVREYCGDDSD